VGQGEFGDSEDLEDVAAEYAFDAGEVDLCEVVAEELLRGVVDEDVELAVSAGVRQESRGADGIVTYSFTCWSTASLHVALSIKSPATSKHFRPSFATASFVSCASSFSSGKNTIVTSAPSRANRIATALPMPELPFHQRTTPQS
jgi:hypothetical protein